MRYPPERKESVLRKMMPPHNRSIKQLAQEEGISEATLFNWRKHAREKGILLPDAARRAGPPGTNLQPFWKPQLSTKLIWPNIAGKKGYTLNSFRNGEKLVKGPMTGTGKALVV